LILLIGAQASFYFQNPEYLRVGYRQLNVGNELREQSALGLMLIVAESFRSSGPAYTTNQIGAMLGVPGILLSPVKHRLVTAGLLQINTREQLIPARDPSKISLADVLAAVRDRHDADIFQVTRWPTKVDKVFADIDKLTSAPLHETNLYGLLDEPPEGVGYS